MLPISEAKIQELLKALEDVNLLLERAKLTCMQAERELKVRLNDRFEVIK